MKNYDHTSLASLAFKASVLPTFKRALHSGDKFFDITFWQLANEEKLNTLIFTNKNLSIGIKGMPGRPGIGIGHKLDNREMNGIGRVLFKGNLIFDDRPEAWISDPFSQKFMEWLGEDSKYYLEFIGNKK